MRLGRSLRPAWLLSLVVAVTALAELPVATTKDLTRLRDQPSGTATQLMVLPPGTRLQVLGEMQGWKQVQTPDGKTGFVWAEHLAGTPGAPAPKPVEPAPAGPDLRDEVHALRDDLTALRDRPEPATAADVERLRAEVERIGSEQRDLARRLDDHGTTAGPEPAGDPSGFPWIILIIGLLAGWGGGRLTQRRRERRQRGKLWW